MASQDMFQQLGLGGDVIATSDDLAEFAGEPERGESEEGLVGRLAQRYGRGSFLPIYEARYRTERLTVPHSLGHITEEDYKGCMQRLRECLADAEARHVNDIRAARGLMRLVLRLFAILQDGREVTKTDLRAFGVSTSPAEGGAADYSLRFHVSEGDYLEYLGGSCDFLRTQRTLWIDAYLDADRDPHIGYLSCIGGADLDIAAHSLPDSAKGRRLALAYALQTILDLHLVHVRPLAFGIGGCRLFSFDECSALWVRLRESAAGGRVGICRTCGTPFIADTGRRFARSYCSEACKRRYLKAVHVLKAIEGGQEPQQAARSGSIALRTVADIAERNGLLREGVNYGLADEGDRNEGAERRGTDSTRQGAQLQELEAAGEPRLRQPDGQVSQDEPDGSRHEQDAGQGGVAQVHP